MTMEKIAILAAALLGEAFAIGGAVVIALSVTRGIYEPLTLAGAVVAVIGGVLVAAYLGRAAIS